MQVKAIKTQQNIHSVRRVPHNAFRFQQVFYRMVANHTANKTQEFFNYFLCRGLVGHPNHTKHAEIHLKKHALLLTAISISLGK